MNDKISTINSQLSMKRVAEYYGYQVNRAGFISCPFHQEKTSSCKIYEHSFHCFGCGAGNDIVDFVKGLFNINFQQALIRLDNDFSLGLDIGKKADRSELLKQKREHEKKQREKARLKAELKAEFNRLAEIHRQFLRDLQEYAPRNDLDFVHIRFITAIKNIGGVEYQLDRLYNKMYSR